MFLLQGSSCIKDFRRAGLVFTGINLFFQWVSLCILVVALYASIKNNEDGVNNSSFYPENLEATRNILLNGIYFFVVDIFFYFTLVYGLVKGVSGILLVWLIFSIVEIIIIQVPLLTATFVMSIYYSILLGVLSTLLHIFVTVYMFHNVCVIFSARHQLIGNKDSVTGNVQSLQYGTPNFVTPQPHVMSHVNPIAPNTFSNPSHSKIPHP